MVMKQLYINGIGTGTYDIFISSDTFLNSPEIAYEAYEVPGLDGSLLKYDKRLNNVARRFDCFCKSNVKTNIEAFKKMLYSQRGYLRIESDYDADTYQMGYLAEGIEFEPFDQSGAYEVKFSIYFSCMPQKFFKTNTNVASEEYPSAIPKLTRVIARESDEMQQIIRQVDLSMIPDADFYAVFMLDALSASGTVTASYANVTATNSTGGFICIYTESTVYSNARYTTYYDVVSYANGTIPAITKTVTGRSTEMFDLVLVPVRIGMGLSVSGTINSQSVAITNNTSTISNYTITASNSSALGASISLEVRYSWRNSTIVTTVEPTPCALYLAAMTNGTVTDECTVNILFDQMPTTLRAELSSYMSSSGITVEISNDQKAVVVNGANRKTITDYLEIRGDLDLTGDEIKCIVTYALIDPSYYGTPKKATIKPEWWAI